MTPAHKSAPLAVAEPPEKAALRAATTPDMRSGFTHLTSLSRSCWPAAFGVELVSTLPLAGRPAPRQRWNPTLSEVWPSLDQPRVGQALAGHPVNEAVEPVERVNLDVALVQAEGELVHVAPEVLGAGVMVDTHQPALQDRPDALNAVRMGRATRVFTDGVVDRLVTVEQPVQPLKNRVVVGVELRARFDALVNRAVDFIEGHLLRGTS